MSTAQTKEARYYLPKQLELSEYAFEPIAGQAFFLGSPRQLDWPLPIRQRFYSRHLAYIDEQITRSLHTQKKPTQPGSPPIPVITLFDRRTISSLLGLRENLTLFASDRFHLHALSLDGTVITRSDMTVHQPNDFLTKVETLIVQKRRGRERVFTLKPIFIDYLIRKLRWPCLYSDIDIYFLQSPAALVRMAPKNGIHIFPHDYTENGSDLAARHGVFNAGLLALGEEATPLVRRWKELVLNVCTSKRGFYYDQKYLETLLNEFPECVSTDRTRDHNRAAWNIDSTTVPHSIHASSPDKFQWFDIKHLWDQWVGIQQGTVQSIPLLRFVQQQAPYCENINLLLRLGHKLERSGIPVRYEFLYSLMHQKLSSHLIKSGDKLYQQIKSHNKKRPPCNA